MAALRRAAAAAVLLAAGCTVDLSGTGLVATEPVTVRWDLTAPVRASDLDDTPVGGAAIVETVDGNKVTADIALPDGLRLDGNWQLIVATGDPPVDGGGDATVTHLSATADLVDTPGARKLVTRFFDLYGGDPTEALAYLDIVVADPDRASGRYFYGDATASVTPYLRIDHRGPLSAGEPMSWFIDYTFDL
jgi:hypothetical protein